MQVGKLKAEIRKNKGNPAVKVTFPQGRSAWVTVQKTALMEALDELYPGKATECFLAFEDGKIVFEQEEMDVSQGGFEDPNPSAQSFESRARDAAGSSADPEPDNLFGGAEAPPEPAAEEDVPLLFG